MTSSKRKWSTDYIMTTYHKFQFTETTSLAISQYNKRPYHEHSKHYVFQQHKQKSTNTTVFTCHTPTGANTVCKERADKNTILKVDYENKHHTDDRSTTRSSRATMTSTMLQC
eukprot:5720869-Amphidinium_carterae.2